MEDWMIVAVSVALGGLIPVAVEWLRGKIERDQRRQDQRDDFQRQTLLDLQEALFRFAQALSIIKQDYLMLKAGQVPPLRVFDNPRLIGQEAGARIVLLSARADDEQLRTIVKSYTDAFKAMSTAEDVTVPDEVAFARQEAIWDLQRLANDRIGELLRQTERRRPNAARRSWDWLRQTR